MQPQKSAGNMSMVRPGYAKEYLTMFTLEKMGKKSTMNDKEKAGVLLSFFTSVFTKENMNDTPDVPS